LFSEMAGELKQNPRLAGDLVGLFIIVVHKKGWKQEEWYLLFQGQQAAPIISTTRPPLPPKSSGSDKEKSSLPIVMIEIDVKDLLNFFTGGLNAYKAITTGKVKVAGDLLVAMRLEEVFKK
ncbi:hypothetical protein BKA69DRAFT_1016042, partial [Paraphysoderma sedebokerense]